MRTDGDVLVQRLCNEFGPFARPAHAPIVDVDGSVLVAVEVCPPASFLKVAEIAARHGLGKAMVARDEGRHVLHWRIGPTAAAGNPPTIPSALAA